MELFITIVVSFVVGFASSVIAGIFLLKWSKIRLALLPTLPKGVKLVPASRDAYVKQIASLIRETEKRVFFKAFTGYDLFSSDVIKKAFEEKRVDKCQECFFLFTNPNSRAFLSEPYKYYTPEHLRPLQQAAIDFVSDRLLPVTPTTTDQGIFFIDEDNNLLNLLILDSQVFFFFRGFSTASGSSANQIIINVDLQKCPPILKTFILYLKDYYKAKGQNSQEPR